MEWTRPLEDGAPSPYYMIADGGRYCICATFDAKDVVYTATRVVGSKATWLAQTKTEIDNADMRRTLVKYLQAKCREDADAVPRA